MTSAAISPVDLTRALVRIPSENPTGTEAAVAAFVREWFEALPGVQVESVAVLPDRPNVIARLPGAGREPPLFLLAHMDTVPIGTGWTTDPFGGEIVDGRLFGRGSTDMKAGLAVAMGALAHAAAAQSRPDRDIVVCATMDEEGTHMLGVTDLVTRGVIPEGACVIATEPSDLTLVTAHKGLLWVAVDIAGKPAHAGNPQYGADAIRCGAEFITHFHRQITGLEVEHPTLGRTLATFSGISGGTKTNVVPESARIEIDIRIPPPLGIADIYELLARSAREAERLTPGCRVSFSQINNDRPPVEANRDHPAAQVLAQSIARVTGRSDVFSVFPAYTDASVVQARTGNTGCFVFGPGLLAQAHTTDEYVETDQIEKAQAILCDFISNLCL